MKPLTIADYNRMLREYNRLVSEMINHQMWTELYQMHGNGD